MDDVTYFIVIQPKYEGKFRPVVLDYGLTYKQAEKRMREYIMDHGLNFTENGKCYEAFCYIKQTKEDLPSGYRILAPKDIKGVLL